MKKRQADCAQTAGAVIEIRPVIDKIWAAGETVDFTALALDKAGRKLESGSYVLNITHSGGKSLCKPLHVNAALHNPFRFSARLDEPGFLTVKSTYYRTAGGKLVKWANLKGVAPSWCGVPVEPEKIRAGMAAPDDIDIFWQKGIEEFKSAPVVIELDRNTVSAGYDVYKIYVKFPDGSGGIDGFLSIPQQAGKYPLIAGVPGAGIGTIDPVPAYVSSTPAIRLWMNVHNFPTAGNAVEQKARYLQYHRSMPDKKRYCFSQAYDREKYIFRRVWLAVNRAVNHIVENIECFDGKRVAFVGSSQGGGSALALSYLNKHTFCTVVNVPALCDHAGWLLNRRPGWPNLHHVWQGRADRSACYFDGANFALRIKTPVLMAVGFADLTSTAASVYAAYNNLPGRKSIYHMLRAGHTMSAEFAEMAGKFLDEEFER